MKEHVMMVGSWPCKVSSEIDINGRRINEPVCEDNGKMTAPKPKDKRDLKKARVVLSKGREVVGTGYSSVTGVAAKVTDKSKNSDNHDWVNQISQNSIMDRHADQVSRVGQVTRVSPNSSTDQWTDQVSQVNRVSRVDNTE
jgi:hypothetical protein